jgi:hypothetical protein
MNLLEKELEEVIFEASKTASGREKLYSRGLGFIEVPLIRQFKLDGYGIADLVGFKFNLKAYGPTIEVDIVELKKDEINSATFFQALGYATGISRALISGDFSQYTHSFNIHLIGKKIETSSNFCYLPDWLYDKNLSVRLYEYKAELEHGFVFLEKSGYSPRVNTDRSMADLKTIVSNKLEQQIGDFIEWANLEIEKYCLDPKRVSMAWEIINECADWREHPMEIGLKSLFTKTCLGLLSAPDQKLEDVAKQIIAEFENLPTLPF